MLEGEAIVLGGRREPMTATGCAATQRPLRMPSCFAG